MPIASGYLTSNTTVNVKPPTGGSNSFPSTFAAFGTFGGGTISLNAGFYDSNGVLQFVPISGASLTAAGAVNIALRCDVLQIQLTGSAGANLGYWIS